MFDLDWLYAARRRAEQAAEDRRQKDGPGVSRSLAHYRRNKKAIAAKKAAKHASMTPAEREERRRYQRDRYRRQVGGLKLRRDFPGKETGVVDVDVPGWGCRRQR